MPLETQVSVMVPNRAGALNEVVGVLSRAGLNIRSLTTTTEAEWAIVGLIVEQPERARQLLVEAGFSCATSQLLVVAMDNVPGELGRITTVLSNANISILQAHCSVEGERALLVLMTTDNQRAAELVC